MSEPIHFELSDDQILQIFHECLAAEKFRNSMFHLGRYWNPAVRLRYSLPKILQSISDKEST